MNSFKDIFQRYCSDSQDPNFAEHLLTCINHDWENMEINEFDFLLTREILTDFCTWDLAPSNCHACDNSTPETPVVKNWVCNIPPRINMTFVGVCACYRRPFMTRSVLDLLARSSLCSTIMTSN